MKIITYENLEIRFFSGVQPEIYKGNEKVGKIDIIFWQDSCEGFNMTAHYLYFKDTVTSLARLSLKDLKTGIEEGQENIKVEVLSKEVESFYAQGPSYWILNKEGEIKSFGPLSAIMKLGPNIQINSTSVLVPLGLNLLVAWHSLKSNKNHFVLFSKQMEYFSSMSIDVKESSIPSHSSENIHGYTVRV